MALVVFLRGINVGGHRRLRPSILARKLSNFDVVNVGAAGTFVVRKPGSRTKFRTELLRKLPFETEVTICDGRDLLRLAEGSPLQNIRRRPDVVRFVSILPKSIPCSTNIPLTLPPRGEWFVRILAMEKRFIFGVYRRRMKTIGYLGQMDRLFGVPIITRNLETMLTVAQILKGRGNTVKG